MNSDPHDELDWLPDGGLNIAYEIVDRHADGPGRNETALVWEGELGEREEYTFDDLKSLSNRFANVLKSLGIGAGDRVCLYIGRLPETYVALVGILKIGAVAVPQPPDVSPETLRDRLKHSSAKVVVTQPALRRRMGATVYELFDLQHIVVVNKNRRDPLPIDTADLDYDQEMEKAADDAEVEATSQLDYATIHYTGGPGLEPLGVVHSHEMLVHSVGAGRLLLGLRDDDLYWPTLRSGHGRGDELRHPRALESGIDPLRLRDRTGRGEVARDGTGEEDHPVVCRSGSAPHVQPV